MLEKNSIIRNGLLLLALAFFVGLVVTGCAGGGGNYKLYGEDFDNSDYENVAIDRIINNHGEYTGNGSVIVTGEIIQVCPTAGCWLMISDGKNSLFVEFFDFTVDIPNRTEITVMGDVRLRDGRPYLVGRGLKR